MATKLSTGNKETIFLNIYRPPSSKMSTFLDEFQNLLEIFVPSPSELIISGDFNIHADSDLSTPNKFSGILDNFHLTQHINFPTHDDGHTLDLLITRSSSTVVTHLSHHESYQSDHKSFTFKFYPHIRPATQRSTIQYRSYNTIDVENFKSDILTSPLYTNPASNASDLADQFSSTLKSILDIHAPIRSKTVVQRPHTPWINPEILQAKRERSRLERCWRRWKSPFDRMKFRAQCNSVRSLISKAKSSFFVQSCNRNIWQPPHTLENPQHNSSSKTFKLTSRVPRCIIPLPTHSLIFSKTKLNASAPNLYHLIFLIRFFLHLPHLQRWPILFLPLSLKFTNSFLPLKANNVPLTPSQLSFWNSASMNSVQSSQILSIFLFLKESFHRHSTTFVQFQTSTSFPKFSKKLLPPALNLPVF